MHRLMDTLTKTTEVLLYPLGKVLHGMHIKFCILTFLNKLETENERCSKKVNTVKK